jgi:YXWGXW repeat-containing protein
MKKVTVIAVFCWVGLFNSLQAQSVAVVKIRPVPYTVTSVCPGRGYVWVNGYWVWDRRHKKNVWVNGNWTRVPQHHHFSGRRVRIY